MMLQIRPDGVAHFAPVRVVHIVPESLVHYAPVEVVHYTPVCSITGISADSITSLPHRRGGVSIPGKDGKASPASSPQAWGCF